MKCRLPGEQNFIQHVSRSSFFIRKRYYYNVSRFRQQHFTHQNKSAIRIFRTFQGLFTSLFTSMASSASMSVQPLRNVRNTLYERIRISTAPHLNPAPFSHTPSFLFVAAFSRHSNHMLWTRVYKHSTGSRVTKPF